MAETNAETVQAIRVPSEEAMFDFLTGLNVSGETCELPCVMTFTVGHGDPSWHGAPFLATLTDPDADHVNYIGSDESGRAQCQVDCDNCGGEPSDWEPTYPVWALVAVWPDVARCREDAINTWWLSRPPHPEVAQNAEQRRAEVTDGRPSRRAPSTPACCIASGVGVCDFHAAHPSNPPVSTPEGARP